MSEKYYLQRIVHAQARMPGPALHVVFADGFGATLDLDPWIARGGIRAALQAPAVFEQVRVTDEGAVEWPDEIDLSPGTLRAWCEAGRVLTPDETNAWIAEHSRASQEVA